jgi:hypothetical protein
MNLFPAAPIGAAVFLYTPTTGRADGGRVGTGVLYGSF